MTKRGKRTCSWKCTFPGCEKNNLDKDVKWHKVPTAPTFPISGRFDQVRRYYIKKKKRFLILD